MNPTKPATYERRALSGIEVREADKASGFIGHLTGYAAMFNSDSLDMGGWTERIAPGAFKRSLAESPDILSFWSHNKDVPVGRTPDTLRVSEDDKGLRFELDLVDTEANRSLLTNVRAKIVRGVSFGFSAVSVKWDAGDDDTNDIRTLLDVDLYEVSPTVWPAYPETAIGERDHKKFLETRKGHPEARSIAFNRGEPETPPTPPVTEKNAKALWEARARFL